MGRSKENPSEPGVSEIHEESLSREAATIEPFVAPEVDQAAQVLAVVTSDAGV